jgi:signal transduction histidine kinase
LDVIIADYHVPHVPQFDAPAALKVLQESGLDIPFIVVSGMMGEDKAVAMMKSGAHDYLMKGNLARLVPAIEREIKDAESRAERRKAEQANRTKTHFLAEMSHEVRTPLNSILGMADLLWETTLSDEQARYVEVFRRAGSNLLIIINEILDLSKIELGHCELERVQFDLEEVVDQAIELIAPKARSKHLSLMCRMMPGLALTLTGDPNRLRQILVNLLGNAVKFTATGQVLLTVQNGEQDQPGEVRISVSDTGIGIASEKFGTIFGDFAQADNWITDVYGGTGLGLAISHRLVRQQPRELPYSARGVQVVASQFPGFRASQRRSCRAVHYTRPRT